jgi:hypothetical protein
MAVNNTIFAAKKCPKMKLIGQEREKLWNG